MTYVVTERCIRCRYMDCVEVCPVPCFLAGETMVVIAAAECIDCGLCEPACPAEAIVHESDPRAGGWLEINQLYATRWPPVFRKAPPLPGADQWKGIAGKSALFNPEPGGTPDLDPDIDPASDADRTSVPRRQFISSVIKNDR